MNQLLVNILIGINLLLCSRLIWLMFKMEKEDKKMMRDREDVFEHLEEVLDETDKAKFYRDSWQQLQEEALDYNRRLMKTADKTDD